MILPKNGILTLVKKTRIIGRNRHSILRRTKWWVRRKIKWFKKLKWWQKTLLIATPLILVAFVIPLLTFAYFALSMGDMDNLMNRNNTGVVLKDRHGEVFYSVGTARHREPVPLDKMADSIKDAVIASEDKNFYDHGGVSILSTLRAVYGYVLSGGGEFGGSTLTQQLAKMTLLSTERGFLRQYQTFSVAVAIENQYTKDEILMMYLNSAYFGNNAFGIEQAARNYFDKTPAELTIAESAMLIGLLPAPSAYSPVTGDAEMAVKRQHEVLERMVENGKISEAERQAAITEELAYQPPAIIQNSAPHFTEMALAELYDRYGEEVVERSGYQVTTTLDLGLQRSTKQAIDNQIGYIQSRGGSNAALIAIDPTSGEIRAMHGSADYQNDEWGAVNVVKSPRQPGSSFKPIYYAKALEDGTITPATIFEDKAININGYSPKNASGMFYGNVTVRRSLAHSLNIPSVLIAQRMGVGEVVKAAEELGITTLDGRPSDYGLSLSLGSAEVPLDQMTNAYAAFANSGRQFETTTLLEIRNKFNDSIFKTEPKAEQVISEGGAYLISHILSDQNARSGMFGSSLSVNGKTVAVKTGTTDEARDAWTIGYTPNIAIGVWVGNNDNTPMQSGGADMAGPIWRNSMAAAIGSSSPSFSRPSNIIERPTCFYNGGIASSSGGGTYSEVYIASLLPSQRCVPQIQTPDVEDDPTPTTPTTPPPPSDDEDEGEEEDGGDEPSDPPVDPVDPVDPSPGTP